MLKTEIFHFHLNVQICTFDRYGIRSIFTFNSDLKKQTLLYRTINVRKLQMFTLKTSTFQFIITVHFVFYSFKYFAQ